MVKVLHLHHFFCTDGLAVDWINDKLYWTDATLKHIEVYDMMSEKRSIVIRTGNLTIPRGIVVDPGKRFVTVT